MIQNLPEGLCAKICKHTEKDVLQADLNESYLYKRRSAENLLESRMQEDWE